MALLRLTTTSKNRQNLALTQEHDFANSINQISGVPWDRLLWFGEGIPVHIPLDVKLIALLRSPACHGIAPAALGHGYGHAGWMRSLRRGSWTCGWRLALGFL